MFKHSVSDNRSLAQMLAVFSCQALEYGFLASDDLVIDFAEGKVLTLTSEDRDLHLTGPDAYGMEDSMEHVTGVIHSLIEKGATIRVGNASIRISETSPLVWAYSPNNDVLMIRTGGSAPNAMTVVVDHKSGLVA